MISNDIVGLNKVIKYYNFISIGMNNLNFICMLLEKVKYSKRFF